MLPRNINFLVNLALNLALKIHQKSTQEPPKINRNSIKNNIQDMIPFFIDFSRFWRPLGPQEAPRPPQDPSKPENREHFQHPTGHHFGRILVPCWPQEPLKGLSKNIQNFHWFGSPSFIDFPRFSPGFGRILDPSWPPKSIKNYIKMLTKFLLEFWSVWVRFLLNLGASWVDFWWILGAKLRAKLIKKLISTASSGKSDFLILA